MVRFKDYHEWPVPEHQDEDYAETFDELFELLDNEIIRKGENFPSAGTEGRWFLKTDEPTIYYDNGTEWLVFAGHNIQNEELIDVGTISFDPDDGGNMEIMDKEGEILQYFTENSVTIPAENGLSITVGDLSVGDGEISEQGDRVATREWSTNRNIDGNDLSGEDGDNAEVLKTDGSEATWQAEIRTSATDSEPENQVAGHEWLETSEVYV